MKRGDTIYLRRPKRLIKATLVALYDNYPAARVMVRGEEKIVARAEVLSADKADASKLELAQANASRLYAKAISAWKPGMSRNEWESINFHSALGCSWHIIRRLKRLGIIAGLAVCCALPGAVIAAGEHGGGVHTMIQSETDPQPSLL